MLGRMAELTEKEGDAKIVVDTGRAVCHIGSEGTPGYYVWWNQGETAYVQDRNMR